MIWSEKPNFRTLTGLALRTQIDLSVTGGTMERTGAEWRVLLDECDFEMAKNEIANMLVMANKEAARSGGAYYYEPNTLAAITEFLGQPSMLTAVSLLQRAPTFYSYFEACSPGGTFYGINRFLRRS
jgi:hypothetical protein